jgi:hypothetical protein
MDIVSKIDEMLEKTEEMMGKLIENADISHLSVEERFNIYIQLMDIRLEYIAMNHEIEVDYGRREKER